MVLLLLVSIGINSAGSVNPFLVCLFYYSLWGMIISFLSMIFSIFAIFSDKAFLLAYYFVEASIASNVLITILYWAVIWNVLRTTLLQDLWDKGEHDAYYLLMYYQILVHILPLLTTLINIAVTRIKPRKEHWYIMMLVFVPGYMIGNIIGAFTIGNGTIYQVENW